MFYELNETKLLLLQDILKPFMTLVNTKSFMIFSREFSYTPQVRYNFMNNDGCN